MQSFTFTYLSNDPSHLLLNIPACWKFFINILYMKVFITRWPPQLNMWSFCSRGRATRLQETQSVRFVWIKKKVSVQFIWCLSFIGDHWRVGDHRWRSWLLRNGSGHHRGEISSYEYTKMVTLLVMPFLFQDIIYAGSKLNIRKFPALGMFRWKSFGHKDI